MTWWMILIGVGLFTWGVMAATEAPPPWDEWD